MSRKLKTKNGVRRLNGAWRVIWNYSWTAPMFNSEGAADAFLDGLFKGRKSV